MPVIKSAKKKLRQDKKRTAARALVEEAFKKAVKKAKKTPTSESARLATKFTDKAVKYHIIHKNKAARIKSSLSKVLAGKGPIRNADAKPATKANKKAAVKKSLEKRTTKSINKSGKK